MGSTVLTTNEGGAAQGAAMPDNQGGTPGAGASNQTSWKDTLPDDLKNDSSLRNIQDVGTLAKSYVNAQKMVGADKILVPSKTATNEEWRSIFQKLGLPEAQDKYEMKLPEGMKPEDPLFSGFREQAFKAGILPKQAEQLLGWYQQANGKVSESIQAERQAELQREAESLKGEWGQAYDKKVEAARAALNQFGDEKIIEHLRETGLGNNPQLIKLLNKVGEALSEGKVVGEGSHNQGVTPDEAQRQINHIMGDAEGPYFNADHPDHDRAVAEVNQLFKYRAGKSA